MSTTETVFRWILCAPLVLILFVVWACLLGFALQGIWLVAQVAVGAVRAAFARKDVPHGTERIPWKR